MRVVLADIDRAALAAAEQELTATGAEAIALVTDVARPEDVQSLADATLAKFGAVHILCSNAGVGPPGGPMWERTIDDWKWVLGVNLWGVIHGIRTFVPILLRQGEDAHIVNTASVVGMVSVPFLGPYMATKHAVVSISETLSAELASSSIGVSVLCPGFVNTSIMDSVRHRPAELSEGIREASTAAEKEWQQSFRAMVATGLAPSAVAERVMDGIRKRKLYIFTDSMFNDAIRQRCDAILAALPGAGD